jgi:outer membrane protein insertion porin family
VFSTVESATRYLGGDVNYERVEVSTSFHQALGKGTWVHLGLTHGAVVPFGSAANNLAFNKRFFPGGDTSLRGYKQDQASPKDSSGKVVGAETFSLGTVEFEQALTPKWSLVVFSDSLGQARRIQHYPFDTGLYSVGGGLNWRTIIGPIRVEYGRNLNPRPGDPAGTLHFSLGFPF